jgi:hypothetical protein
LPDDADEVFAGAIPLPRDADSFASTRKVYPNCEVPQIPKREFSAPLARFLNSKMINAIFQEKNLMAV